MEKGKQILLEELSEDIENLERYIEEFSIFLPLPVCSITPRGIIININQATKDLTGYNETAMVGQETGFLFKEKDVIKKVFKRGLKEDIIKNQDLTLLTQDKKQIPVNISIASRKDRRGNIVGYFLAISNISDFKKLQEGLEEEVAKRTKDLEQAKRALVNMLEDTEKAKREIEEEQNKTRATLTSLIDGLVVFNEEEEIILVNPEAESILGLKEKQVLGKRIDRISGIPNLTRLYKALGQKIEKVGQKHELVLDKPFKSFFQITVTPAVVRGKTFGTIVVLHDITREREIDRMKSEFVSIAAHQLRTPLSAIKWGIKMVLDGDVGKLNKEQIDLLFKSYKSNERIIKLVNDLLNVSRIEEGRFGFTFRKTNFQKVLDIAISNLEKKIAQSHLDLKLNKPDKLPEVYMDEQKMALVLQNILDNAVKYTPEYGKIEISVKIVNKSLKVTVKDSGIGIPTQEKAKLFSKFFRGSNVLRTQTEGTGLGLFIAKNIINKHGGKIALASTEGKGTKVSFSLPLKS